MDMQRFWHGSLYRGAAARALARKARLGQWQRLFVSGLLSDIGQPILDRVVPLESDIALSRGASEPVLRENIELMMPGFDHADVSAALARKWQLPEAICHCLEYQRHPLAGAAHAANVCAVHVSARIARWVWDEQDAPPPLGQHCRGAVANPAGGSRESCRAARAHEYGVQDAGRSPVRGCNRNTALEISKGAGTQCRRRNRDGGHVPNGIPTSPA